MFIETQNAVLLVSILVLSALLQLVIAHKHQRQIENLKEELLQTMLNPYLDLAESSEKEPISRQP